MSSELLASHINLLDVTKDGCILGFKGEMAYLYEIEPGQDVTLMTECGQQTYLSCVKTILESLPAQAAASILSLIEEDGINPVPLSGENTAVAAEILESKRKLFAAMRRLKRKHYLYLGIYPKDFFKPALSLSALFSPGKALEALKQNFKQSKESLAGLEASFLAQLAGVGVKAKRFTREETISFYWKMLNPGKYKALPPPRMLPECSLRSQLAISPAEIQKNCIWIDGRYIRFLSLYTFSESVELGGLDKLMTLLPEGSSLSIHIMGLDLERAINTIKEAAHEAANLIYVCGAKNYEAQQKAKEGDELISSIRSTGGRIYLGTLTIGISDAAQQGVMVKSAQVHMALREALGAEALAEDFLHMRHFAAALPHGAPLAARRHFMTGELAGSLLALSAPWQGSPGPGLIFMSREKEIVRFNVFYEGTPRHGMVLGSTGSGKSFTMNYLALNLWLADPKISMVIVDIGGSYRKLCDVLGGHYFELHLSSEYAINPMPSREAMVSESGELDADLLGYLRILIEKMAAADAAPAAKKIIESAIRRLYQNSNRESPLLEELITALTSLPGSPEDKKEAASIARNLGLYSEGMYGKILNAPACLRPFEGRLTIFDLARLKEHKELQAILMYMIGFGLARKLKDPEAKKVIIIDEGWEFFDDPAGAELISRLYRTARKFNAAVISVSQSPKDFVKSLAGRAINANSFWKLFLRMDMGHEALAHFGLNARELDWVRRLEMRPGQFAEMFVRFGNRSRILRLIPSAWEYWLATTNAEELAYEAKLRAERPQAAGRDILRHLVQERPLVYA